MAQYRQSFSTPGAGAGGGAGAGAGAGVEDHVSVGIRIPHKQQGGGGGGGGGGIRNHRRSVRSDHKNLGKISVGALIVFLSLLLLLTVFSYYYISTDKDLYISNPAHNNYADSLSNVTTPNKNTITTRVVKFGHASIVHGGRDSRYWDTDDPTQSDSQDITVINSSQKGFYNEAGRHELRHYEAQYEASLKNVAQINNNNQLLDDDQQSTTDVDDEYDDGIDPLDAHVHIKHEKEAHDHDDNDDDDGGDSTDNATNAETQHSAAHHLSREWFSQSIDKVQLDSRHVNSVNARSSKRSSRLNLKRRSRHHKFSASSCQMRFLNSTGQLIEPLESQKFSRFSLRYTEVEERPSGEEQWEPRFAGHQSLQEREDSFYTRDQKINCGFVKGPKGSPSTGFDLAEDDARFMGSCHIAVSSCIFGNSDNLRTPFGKMVTRLSRKNVCFVMFMDEITLQTLTSEGHKPDRMGFIGLWKIVVVKNLPYVDMRRVGKIPKFLTHRLFPSARYSIWLDSKLRLQSDPLIILEYFLWRKGYEYAISNHYDRHCVWEEVAQNKKLNKFNHTIIDQQFDFYQTDGLRRFNASDPNKLLPSNVPEGSFIMRAHTPVSNLFSCLWFNEVDRFTPRDQLSFAYTYLKLNRMNPGKPFHLNMFKDCERRAIAKLFRHRSEEKRNIPLQATRE